MIDLLALEDEVSEEARMVQRSTREFVEDRIRPDIGRFFQEGEFPLELIPEMGDLGLYGPNIAFGDDPGIDPLGYGLMMQELGACDSGIRSMVSVQGALVMYPIDAFGSDHQRETWLPRLRDGELVGCFALTEPEHGSNPAAMNTRAEATEDGYRLHGTKTWTTNAPIADLALVWARDMSAPGDPVRGFLVETDWDGVAVNEIEGKLSLRASRTGEIALQGVIVPEDHVLPGVEGMRGPLSCLTQARFGIAWGTIGVARDCFEVARAYALDREQFGHPIGRYQLQQEKLAEMATQISLGQLLAFRLAELKARGELTPIQVSLAKRNNVRMARNQARVAREMLGGNGITVDYPPMRHMINMETVYTYEGTHDIHTLIIGEELTGLSAFSAD